MTDERHQSGYRIPRRQPAPGELLFEFHVERTKKFWRVELRDHGDYGVEAQFYDSAEFRHSRRWPTRELAIAWAEQERKAMGR